MARRRSGTLLPLELDILGHGLELQTNDDPVYGYSLAKAIAGGRAGGLTAHGTLYKALGRLVESGLLETAWEDADAAEAEGRPRRKLYRVTGEGARAVSAATAALPSIARPARGLA